MKLLYMELIQHFKDIGKGDAAIAGGKGASLGEMTRVGIPVPPGFVVLSEAFEHFLRETDLHAEIDAVLRTVNKEAMHTVEEASAKIGGLIRGAKMPEAINVEILKSFKELNAPFVAVRSSATAEDSASAAWAGQLDSYLNTTEQTLLINVQRCWASLFTPRAIFYRFENNLHEQHISVAVVVQKMVDSEVSGIAFSVHPVTEDRNQLIIEAGFGLGEAIVSGQVTPDSYVVEKEPRKIIDINVSTQARALYRKEGGGNEWKEIEEPKASSQVLTEAQILELAGLVVRIEDHYGFPCDIEWAFEAGSFYIVQSRPITTLSDTSDKTAEDAFLEKYELNRYENWNEQGRWILPPFVSSTMSHHHMVSEYAKSLFPDVSIKSYFVIDYYAFQLHKDKKAIFNYTKALYLEGKLDELNRAINTFGEDILGRLEIELQKDEVYRKENAQKLLELYRDLNDFWLLESYFGDLCIDLAKDVGYIRGDSELFGKVQPYLRDTWIEVEVHDAVAIAEYCIEKQIDPRSSKDKTVEKLLIDYVLKYSWSKYSWWLGEPIDVSYALERVSQEMRNIEEGNHIKTLRKEDTPDPLVELSVVTSYWRAQCGRMIMMAGEKLGFIFEAIALENGIRKEEALLLTYQEVLSLIQKENWKIENLQEVLDRKNGHFVMGDNEGGLIIFNHSDPRYAPLKKLFVDRQVEVTGDVLTGIAASPGKVTGKVHVIQSASEFDSFIEGEILVSVETSPMFVPLMRKAAAILTGKGGITSHAAIVSRELKKPCVIAIKDIVKILKTGDEVEVDANKGVVRILQKNQVNKTYVRFLHVKDFPYLIADIFYTTYKDLNAVIMASEGQVDVFLPQKGIEETQVLGESLFGSPTSFEKLRSDFEEYKSRLQRTIENIATEPEHFLNLLPEFFTYYSKTEFFYLDGYVRKNQKIESFPAFIEQFEEFKNDARSFLNSVFFGDAGSLARALAIISEKTGVSNKDLQWYSLQELNSLWSDGTKSLIAGRKKAYSFGKTTEIDIALLKDVQITNSATLKGTIAAPGKVKGPAFVISYNFQEFDSMVKKIAAMPEGSILVAETTSPEYMPACKIALGIITNQGGLLSHAAIVSRELGIPCLVAVDLATERIHTGDEIELDADTGVVRILGR